LELLLSSQLLLIQAAFSQQEKDSAIIHKEVMSEYDIKYVHPRLNPLVRDVGTQYTGPNSEVGTEEGGDVETYTPTVILRRGFRTNPNPNYAKHVDPENASGISRQTFSPTPGYTPSTYNSRDATPFTGATPRPPLRQPQFRQSLSGAVSTGTSTGDGGNLGIYSHANSPLKKATSMYDIQGTPKNSFDMAGREIQEQKQRSKSPTKRQSDAPRAILENRRLIEDHDRRTSAPTAFGIKQRHGTYVSPYSRGPSRF